MNSKPFSPTITTAIKIVEALISAEPEPDEKVRERVKWIHDYTHEKVNVPISIIELAVFRNLNQGLNRELEIYGKTFNLTHLYKILDEVSVELTNMVVLIAKKYSVDIPVMSSFNRGGNIQI